MNHDKHPLWIVCISFFNSSPTSAKYMCQWIDGILLIGLLGTNSVDIVFRIKLFHSQKYIWKWQLFYPGGDEFTHWGPVMHICVSTLTITGSDNGLSPGRRQAIIWTNAGLLLTNFSENLIKILTFSLTKMQLKVSSAKWQPFCLCLNVLMHLWGP